MKTFIFMMLSKYGWFTDSGINVSQRVKAAPKNLASEEWKSPSFP